MKGIVELQKRPYAPTAATQSMGIRRTDSPAASVPTARSDHSTTAWTNAHPYGLRSHMVWRRRIEFSQHHHTKRVFDRV
jgi:hypothetical protein